MPGEIRLPSDDFKLWELRRLDQELTEYVEFFEKFPLEQAEKLSRICRKLRGSTRGQSRDSPIVARKLYEEIRNRVSVVQLRADIRMIKDLERRRLEIVRSRDELEGLDASPRPLGTSVVMASRELRSRLGVMSQRREVLLRALKGFEKIDPDRKPRKSRPNGEKDRSHGNRPSPNVIIGEIREWNQRRSQIGSLLAMAERSSPREAEQLFSRGIWELDRIAGSMKERRSLVNRILIEKEASDELSIKGIRDQLSDHMESLERQIQWAKAERSKWAKREKIQNSNASSGPAISKVSTQAGINCKHGLPAKACVSCTSNKAGGVSALASKGGEEFADRSGFFADSSHEFQQLAGNLEQYVQSLLGFVSRAWEALCSSERAIALEENSEHRFVMPKRIEKILGIKAIVLIARQIDLPGIRFRLQGAPSEELEGRLDQQGSLVLMAKFDPPLNRAIYPLLKGLVTACYHDLVIHQSGEVVASKSKRGKPPRGSRKKGSVKRPRRLPRGKSSEAGSRSARSQTRAAASISGFRRRLPLGYSASPDKIFEAAGFGVDLKGPEFPEYQYTFVSPHVRGGKQGDRATPLQSVNATRLMETLIESLAAGAL